MRQPTTCPRCGSTVVHRARRSGLERILSLFYVYPYRCALCLCRFRLLRWGVRYVRRAPA